MSWIKSREFALGLASAVMVYMFLEYFFVLPKAAADLTSGLKNLAVVISAFAFVLAALNITVIHGRRVTRKDKGWIYSACLLGMFAIMLLIGIPFGTAQSQYMWIQRNIYTPTSAAVWGIMGFYYVAACYSVFRVRNVDAFILFASGLIVVLNNAPAIAAFWPQINAIAGWVQDVPGTSGIRGCYITVGVGLVALAIRVIMLIEKRFFVGGE